MMGIEDKTLLCFCHWGKRNKVLPDGSISYGGGITDQVVAKTGVKYDDFVIAVFDRLGIEPSDKMLFFTVKFDRSELIRLRDQEGIDTLLQFNDDYAHVYASSLEKEPDSRPPSGCTKKVEHIIASDKQPDTTPVGDDLNGNKCGVLSKTAVGKLPPHHDNQEPFVGQNNTQNDSNALFHHRNYHRHKRLTSSGIQETFWRKCDTCNTWYMCDRNDVNRALRCKACTTFDLGSQGAACRPKQSQPGGQDKPLESKLNKPLEQRELPNQGISRMTGGSAGFPPTQTGSQQVAATTKVDCKSRKRYRKQIAESSESDDTSISVDSEDLEREMDRIPLLDKLFRASKP